MPIDIADLHKADSFAAQTEVLKSRVSHAVDHHPMSRPAPESAEQQLLKYMQESKGAHYGHAGTLLSRLYRKS